MDLDEIDGYQIREALGAGSVGAVWLARDLASGRPVVIKRVPVTSVLAPEVFRRDLALARGLDHDHVVRLAEVRQAEREWLLVSEYVPAGTLTELLQRRGPLRSGELVTLLSPIAHALAAAHQAGLTHGHVGGGDILLDADGRPMLADLGLRLTAGERDQPAGAADDLAALGRLAREAGGDPAVFTDSLFSGEGTAVAARLLALAAPEPIGLGFGDETVAADPDPATRATAAVPRASVRREPGRRLSRQSKPACKETGSVGSSQNTPGRWPSGRIRSRRSAPERGRSASVQRVSVPAVVAGGVVAAGVLAGLGINELLGGAAQAGQAGGTAADHSPVVASSTAVPPTSSQSATQAATPAATPDGTRAPTSDGTPAGTPQARPGKSPPASEAGAAGRSVRAWTATLTALDGLRAKAFARLDAALLDAVYRSGSAPWRSDRALLASYRQRDIRVDGLRIEIQRVQVERPGRDTVVLRVVDRFAGATAIDSAGRRTALPAGQPTTRLITLIGSGEHWQISGIVQA